jgi:hypothetical protein
MIEGVSTTLVVPQMANSDFPALAAAERQTTGKIDAGAKAQHLFDHLSARLKSCPDTSCNLQSNFASGS